MAMHNALFSKEQFKNLDANFKIGVVISDGMWYSLPKWRKLAKVTEEEINNWINENLASGRLIQSETGAKSYRFPLSSIEEWYRENDLELGKQLVESLFPPRIWGGLTETEGFLATPLRELGMVSFHCSPEVYREIAQELKGIARIRESELPGLYKAYCLDPTYVKPIVTEVFKRHEAKDIGKIYIRTTSRRREMVDFPREYRDGIILFYRNFAKALVKGGMETIKIFLPDHDEQDAQIIMWVMIAIEKYDELESVPFSGYLDSVLSCWPYSLPYNYLGKELSYFQRSRARAIKKLKKTTGRTEFTIEELCKEMNCSKNDFINLDEKHKIWISAKTATSLTWDENSEEKRGQDFNSVMDNNAATDPMLAHKISYALIKTALETEDFKNAMIIISQIDTNNINLNQIKEVNEEFIQALGVNMGVNSGV